MRELREQAVFWIAATQLGVCYLLQLDALTVLLHGGSLEVVLLAWSMAALLGAVLGVALWAAGRLLWELGLGLARLSARLRGPALSPLLLPVLCGALAGTYALAPAHRVFAQHPATMALMMSYLPFALSFVLGVFALIFRARRFRLTYCALAALAVLGLHLLNRWYYPALYRPVHDALTGVAIVTALSGAALALVALRPRTLLLGVLGASALAALVPLFVAPSQLRTLAYFDGTELHHVLAWAERSLDRDTGGSGAARAESKLAHSVAARPRSRGAVPVRALDSFRAAHPRSNVVLILIDTLRADVVGALGSKRGLTPELDAFAKTATVFEQARTTLPRTEPALVSMARARFHGRNLRCRHEPIESPTLAGQLDAQGYVSVARLVGEQWAGSPVAEGFRELIQKGSFQAPTGKHVTSDALQILQRVEPPFLLLLHYADPHSPYHPHPGVPRRGSGVAAAYGAEVEATDREFGSLLRALRSAGRLEDTVVVVFSDHGENLGERGSRGGHHGVSVYDEDVRVPLLIYAPGVPPRRIGDPVSIIDITPTLLDLVGAPALEDVDGRSLVGYLLGEPPEPTWTLSEFYEPPYLLRGIVDGHHKLIHDVGHDVHRLFDLKADPGELRDIAALRPERVASLFAMLDPWLRTHADTGEPDQCTPGVSRGR